MDATQEKILVQLNQAITQTTNGSPFVTLSFGMSLDGKIATYTGDSKYISGPETRQFVHELRDRHDAILVGIQTIQADHPLLTTRLLDRQGKDAHRIILDSNLNIDMQEPILHHTSSAMTYVVCKAHAAHARQQKFTQPKVQLLVDPTVSGHIDLPWLMATLKSLKIQSVLVEGGGTIHESFIRQGFFNHIYAQISPLLIGGKDAKTPVEGQGFATLKEATRVAFDNHFICGKDIIIFAKKV